MTSKHRGLPIAWFGTLQGEDKRKFDEAVRNALNTPVMGRLVEIIEGNLRSLEASEGTLMDYDNPSWSHKQAHRNGLRQGYLEILKLLK